LAEQGRTKGEAELVDSYYEAHNPGEVLPWKFLLNKQTRERGQITGTNPKQHTSEI